MSATDHLVRLAAIQARAKWEDLKAEAASLFLDKGMDPGFTRRDLECPWLADVMEDVLREETQVRQGLGLPAKAGRQIGGTTT